MNCRICGQDVHIPQCPLFRPTFERGKPFNMDKAVQATKTLPIPRECPRCSAPTMMHWDIESFATQPRRFGCFTLRCRNCKKMIEYRDGKGENVKNFE